MTKQSVTVKFRNNEYSVAPNISLLCEMEDELGNLGRLHHNFCHETWKLCDVVSIVHMMLASVDVTVDYQKLGERILKEGIVHYSQMVKGFLTLALLGRRSNYEH